MKNFATAIFSYNRPSHLKRVLIALDSKKIKHIYVFLDGPKNTKDKLIQEQIIYMLKKNKNIKVKLIHRKKNFGLAKSLLTGIDYLSSKYKSFLVLEDDVVPYKKFFKFAEVNLKKYENDDNIAAIFGYQFPELNSLKGRKNFTILNNNFIPWGWGTWSSKWRKFRSSKIKSYELENMKKNFIINFFKSKVKKKTIWSADFILYNFNYNKKYLCPKFSLVKNIGFDGSGINSKISNKLRVIEQNVIENNFSLVKNSSRFNKIFEKTYKKRLNLFY